jgi:hypothetical protein
MELDRAKEIIQALPVPPHTITAQPRPLLP